jgi:hypothetical protein
VLLAARALGYVLWWAQQLQHLRKTRLSAAAGAALVATAAVA